MIRKPQLDFPSRKASVTSNDKDDGQTRRDGDVYDNDDDDIYNDGLD